MIKDKIAAMFQVSRMPVREVLQVLENEGLVYQTSSRHVYATGFSREDGSAILMLLKAIEKELAEIKKVYEEESAIIANEDYADYSQKNNQLHSMIWQLSGLMNRLKQTAEQ